MSFFLRKSNRGWQPKVVYCQVSLRYYYYPLRKRNVYSQILLGVNLKTVYNHVCLKDSVLGTILAKSKLFLTKLIAMTKFTPDSGNFSYLLFLLQKLQLTNDASKNHLLNDGLSDYEHEQKYSIVVSIS